MNETDRSDWFIVIMDACVTIQCESILEGGERKWLRGLCALQCPLCCFVITRDDEGRRIEILRRFRTSDRVIATPL